MGVAIYARLSRNPNGESTSIDRQVAACRQRLEEGWEVQAVHTDDDVSAYSLKVRPGFEALLADAEAGKVDVIVAYALDRLLRQSRDLERLIDSKVRFITVRDGIDSTSPSGGLITRIMAAIAQNESDTIGARIRLKHDELRAQGRHSGGRVPFGWGEGEADVIREVAGRLLAGDSLMSVSKLVGRDPTTVKRMLLSPRMIGRRTATGPVGMPVILDEETWRSVQRVLLNPDRQSAFTPRRRHLLTGFLTCGACGGKMWTHSKTKPPMPRYACLKKKGGCGTVSINAQPTESFVYDEWLAFTSSDTYRQWIDEANRTDEENQQRAEAMRAELSGLRERLYPLMDMYTSGALSLEEWQHARQGLDRQIGDLEQALERVTNADPGKSYPPDEFAADDWAQLWEQASLEGRRAELASIFPSGWVIMPAKARGRRFDSSRIVRSDSN